MKYVRPAFEDLLRRLQTDYIDLGMIHYVDSEKEWEQMQHSDYLGYVMELKNSGVIRPLICCPRARILTRCLRRHLTLA